MNLKDGNRETNLAIIDYNNKNLKIEEINLDNLSQINRETSNLNLDKKVITKMILNNNDNYNTDKSEDIDIKKSNDSIINKTK